jgi:hypothetical protein
MISPPQSHISLSLTTATGVDTTCGMIAPTSSKLFAPTIQAHILIAVGVCVRSIKLMFNFFDHKNVSRFCRLKPQFLANAGDVVSTKRCNLVTVFEYEKSKRHAAPPIPYKSAR